VEALEEAETFCVYETEFARLRREHPSVNEFLIRLLGTEVRIMNERLLEALYLPVERRVLRRLSELTRLYSAGADDVVQIPLTQEELAGLAGTSRATVNAVLGDAQARGLVELRRGKVRIVDRAGLAARARL
jgi:CRP-like cAMP-binding protein